MTVSAPGADTRWRLAQVFVGGLVNRRGGVEVAVWMPTASGRRARPRAWCSLAQLGLAAVAIALLLAAGSAAPTFGGGSTAALVADINATTPPYTPAETAEVGGTLMFAGTEVKNGTELWRVDPVTHTAGLVLDINPGSDGSSPTDLTDVGGIAFFVADDGIHGRELWTSDGTAAGTVLVKEINLGGDAKPASLTALGGVLFFEADDGVHGRELWRSDGTKAGTVQVADVNEGSANGLGLWFDDYYTSDLTPFGGDLYFAGDDGAHGWELWRSDGTKAGTTLIRDVNPGAGDGLYSGSLNFPQLEAASSLLYFVADDGAHGFELWRSNGTAGGTALVVDLEPGPGGSLLSWPYASDLTAVGANVFFVIEDTAHGWAVVRSDGTAAGTVVVLDTWNPAYELTDFDGTLYFGNWACCGPEDITLWKSDGTPGGTVPASGVHMPGYLTVVDGFLLFRGEWTHGWELFRHDGLGAIEVADINPTGDSMPSFPGDLGPFWLTEAGGALYFKATDGVYGFTLWTSDGTATGTVPVPQAADYTLGSRPAQLTQAGTRLFFTADDGVHGVELWTSDGTAAGTAQVEEITPGGAGDGPAELTALGDELLFVADDGVHGFELWRSDGTASGTAMLKDVTPGTGGYGPPGLTRFGSDVYFSADDGVHGWELWRTDGTAAGTELVTDLNPGSAGSFPRELTPHGGSLYFADDDGVHGFELWKTDGTAAGTALVRDVNPGAGSGLYYSPSWLTPVGTDLFFVGTDGVHGSELWKTDGTEAGTGLVADIVPGAQESYVQLAAAMGGGLYFTADTSSAGNELWRSDGTAAGTAMVIDLAAGPDGSWPGQLTAVAGALYFVADDLVHGSELWTTDGTAAGTALVADLVPGTAGSAITSLTAVGDTLYFAAREAATGEELHRMPVGTEEIGLVADVRPGSAGSLPANLEAVGGTVFFTADDGVHGEELWSLGAPPPPADAAPSVTSTAPGDGATGVALASDLVVSFSEAVHVSADSFALTCADTGAHAFALTGGPAAFTLDPDVDLGANESCELTVLASAVSDEDANDPPDTMAADVSVRFTAVALATTTTLTVTPGSQQYSDHVDLAASIVPSTATGSVQFRGSSDGGATYADLGAPVVVVGGAAVLEHVQVLDAAGAPVRFEAVFEGTGAYGGSEDDVALTVTPEDAAILYADGNPLSAEVTTPGGGSWTGPLTLGIAVRERVPDDAGGGAAGAGDVAKAGLAVQLVPLASGAPVPLTCAPGRVTGSGYDATRPFVCTSPGAIALGTYEVAVTVTSGHYAGASSSTFTVYDRSLGFATGGGRFALAGDPVSFGFAAKFNRKGTNLQGGFVAVRHHADGTVSRLKSTSLGSLSILESGGCGIASFDGKATYTRWDPSANGGSGAYVTTGNASFVVRADDCDAGNGPDRIWIGGPGDLAMGTPAASHLAPLAGGNVAVPHMPGQKG
jgi:ELWxxDGT repeat protein